MIPIVRSLHTKNVLLCLNQIISRLLIRSDAIVYAINNEFRFSFPTVQIDINGNNLKLQAKNMPNVYVLDLDMYNLSDLIAITYRHRFFNPRANFILVRSELLRDTSEILIDNFMVNVIYLETETENIFTIFPYDERMLNNPSQQWRNVLNCRDNLDVQKLFQQKIPKIWRNSGITVMYLPFRPFMICTECEKKGAVFDVLEESLYRLNLSVEYTEIEYNEDFEEYDRNLILDKKFDLSLGELVDLELDNLYTHDYTSLYWVVPIPNEMPRWKYLFTAFSEQVWMIWILTFASICIAWFAIHSLFFKPFMLLNFLVEIVNIIKMSIEQSADLNSTMISENIIFVLIYFFTWMMTTLYKNRFLYFLLGFNYEKIIDSVEDIMENNLTICSPMFTAVQGPFLESKIKEQYFNSHYIDCNFSDHVFFRLITDRDVTFVDNDDALNYYESEYADDEGRSLFHKIDEPIITSQFGSTLIKGHPITENLNRYFMLISQHGIKNLIMSKYHKFTLGQSSDLQTQPLSISHVITSFYVLALGVSLGLFSFSCERLFG